MYMEFVFNKQFFLRKVIDIKMKVKGEIKK